MLIWAILAIALSVGLYIITGGTLFADLDGGQFAYLLVGGALIALYVVSLRYDYQARTGQALRHALTWIGVFLLLITGYAYRDVLSEAAARVTGELAPAGTALQIEEGSNGERSVRLRRRSGGHFAARAAVNDIALSMLVDTGASTVVLKTADAEKAGIEVSSLTFSVPVDTANGTTFAAPVRIRSIAIGSIEVRDVEALVAKPGNLKESLLGMSFLRRLRSYEFSGEYLTLRG